MNCSQSTRDRLREKLRKKFELREIENGIKNESSQNISGQTKSKQLRQESSVQKEQVTILNESKVDISSYEQAVLTDNERKSFDTLLSQKKTTSSLQGMSKDRAFNMLKATLQAVEPDQVAKLYQYMEQQAGDSQGTDVLKQAYKDVTWENQKRDMLLQSQ